MINNKLRDEIGALNASKGWHDEPRSIAQHCILLHSEVSEIVEDYRDNKEIDHVWYEYKNEDFLYSSYNDVFIRDSKEVFSEYKDCFILGKPCGIPSELADVVIRALDMAYEYEVDIYFSEEDVEEFDAYEELNAKEVEFLFASLHKIISEIITEEEQMNLLLNALIVTCIYISNRYNINLEQQIQDKIAYNRTRPIKHGGKRL